MPENLQEHINMEIREDIKQLYKHADIANREMGVIKNDVSWIKSALGGLDNRVWAILGTIVVGFLTSIVLILIK